MRPLAIDLFCGLGGWSEALIAEGWRVVGFDIERHEYGAERYPGQLVIQDVLTIHGSQFKDADLIVASPPCQFFSYTAMPWSRAKNLAAEVRADPARLDQQLALFRACFRIQKEACEAAGRHIPLIVENVRGAIPWVGHSRWNFGSFHLWGDVPALMPRATKFAKVGGFSWSDYGKPDYVPRAFNGTAEQRLQDGIKVPSFRFDGSGRSFQSESVRRTDVGKGARFTSRDCGVEETKCGGDWFNADQPSISRLRSSKSPARKAASAMIAKIPAPLARHIARTFYPARAAA